MAAQTQSEIALRAVQADITTLAVHAIVNAANETLLGGGGVGGAIHNVAGPGLLRECRALGGCPTGEARITGGHGLPSGFVIHTVGPVWKGGGAHEAELLRACYLNSLALAEQHQLAIVAFPSISTGVYGYPKEPAARIAIASVREFSTRAQFVAEVIFCCFAEADLVIYRRLLAAEAA